ncbi:MAG: hypothetical protein KJ687_05580, partial [Proteobacteria bacterium]|nr:hypothetical protein [Pseudomonadota bacterium]
MFTKLLYSYIEIFCSITYDTFHVQRHKQLQRGFLWEKTVWFNQQPKEKRAPPRKKQQKSQP